MNRIVLGTANIGLRYGRNRSRGLMSEAAAVALLDAAWSLGIRTFDTAKEYGESAPRLARWLNLRRLWDHVAVVTKVKPAKPAQLREHLREAIETFRRVASLTVLSHDMVNGKAWQTFVGVAEERGAVVGQSVYSVEEAGAVLKLPDLGRLQVPGNVFDRDVIDACGDASIPFDIRSVFLQGVLLETPEVAEARVAGAGQLARGVHSASSQVGEPPAVMLAAAVLALCRPGDRLVLGVDSPEQLQFVARAASVPPSTVEAFVERAQRGIALPVSRAVLDPRRWRVAAPSERKAELPKVVAIIQARLSSSRLPRKVLAPIGAMPMIDRLLHQMSGTTSVDQVVVATSQDSSDDELAAHLEGRGVEVVRGDLNDVLGRFGAAAARYDADVIVRLTGDCPLLTPDTVDDVVSAFLAADVDYATNIYPYTRPDGLDVEVFTRQALTRAIRETAPGPDREHVTPFLRRAGDLRRLYYLHRTGPHGAGLRWTVDVPEDLEYVRRIWAKLDELGPGPHAYEAIMEVAQQLGVSETVDISNRGYYKSIYAVAEGVKAPPLRLAESEAMLARSAQVIPGGAQTYSKSWRQHIRGVSPIFLERGEGARVWDVDGNEYVDLIQGLLPNILGYAHPDVDRAAYEQARRGHSFSLAHPLEVELAERLTRLIPCAEMVRFGKNGSDATAGAVRVARAFTRRERVAVCGYHGWQDWFIGSTTRNAGVPQAVCDLAHQFPYNDAEALERLLASHKGEFAAVIMEPYNFYDPSPGYLQNVKKLAHDHGALLIFDEICTGFHFGLGGAQKRFGVLPDLATFGKAMGNGYPISCIVGRRDVMRTFDDVFVSFTFAGDVAAMAAALTVLDILEHTDALARMEAAGRRLANGAVALAGEAGLSSRFLTHGHHNWLLLRFLDEEGRDDPVLRALWVQEVVRRGVLLIQTHNICAALDYAAVEHVLRAYAEGFKYVGRLVETGADLQQQLDGPVPTPAFRVRG
jgi:glutamate-1-semialdehyde 2,1-aminomutase/spore coat polysaccharide biosynthesis protein SpsF